jgi:hypothetical protein
MGRSCFSLDRLFSNLTRLTRWSRECLALGSAFDDRQLQTATFGLVLSVRELIRHQARRSRILYLT